MSLYPEAVILVFCKAPVPGQVKTRLIPHITPEDAAQLHCELTINALQTVTTNNLCDVQLWCSPSIDEPFFNDLRHRFQLNLKLQHGTDLGMRMDHALTSALVNYRSAVLIGCDCPSLTNQDLEEALINLQSGKNCVLAPAEDGGYVLIGLNQPESDLFINMPWGTPQILEITRKKINRLNLTCHELTSQWDVDVLDDLSRYRAEILKSHKDKQHYVEI